MTTKIQKIIEDRAKFLLQRFHHDMMPPKMALGGPDVRRAMVRHWPKGVWQAIPGIAESDAMMWRDAADPHRSSAWAFPAYKGYRDAYIAFLKTAYTLTDAALPPKVDVDHLQAKSTVNASGVIRLEAVGASPNRSHGASPEKKMSKSTVTAGRMARDHTPGSMTWLVALKLAGLLAPRIGDAPSALARRQAAVDFFVARGWAREEVERGLAGLFEVQARR